MLEIFTPGARSLVARHLEQNGYPGRFAAAQRGFLDSEDHETGGVASDTTVWELLIKTPNFERIFDGG